MILNILKCKSHYWASYLVCCKLWQWWQIWYLYCHSGCKTSMSLNALGVFAFAFQYQSVCLSIRILMPFFPTISMYRSIKPMGHTKHITKTWIKIWRPSKKWHLKNHEKHHITTKWMNSLKYFQWIVIEKIPQNKRLIKGS